MPLTTNQVDSFAKGDSARLASLLPHIEEGQDQEQPPRDQLADDGDQFLSVGTLRSQYLDYLYSKSDEIDEQQDARRYYHGAQLTAEQRRVLIARHQPIQIWNRIARNVNRTVGFIERMRSDPKAEGRDPKSEAGAEIATQSIRAVLDGSLFKTSIAFPTLLQAGIDGIGGVQLVLTIGDQGDPDIGLTWVIGDEYFYDPKSYRFDFKDNKYEGIAKWMDLDSAIQMFPDKRDLLEGLFQGDSDLTTNPDRDIKWIVSTSKNLRIVEHWYSHRGQWCWAFYCANQLLDQGLSPWFDEKGNRVSSFEMFSAAIDHDGDRYGLVRNFKGPQDALNQGKSKTLALANSRRVIADKGAVDDAETARREVARHDGFVEKNKGFEFKVDDTHPDIATFTSFTEDAKTELDSFANANLSALAGTAGMTNLSGKAIELLRQPGMAELGPFILSHTAFRIGLYRKIWNGIQRHWTKERWIRVNNNEKLAQFIQLNGLDLDQWGRPVIVNAVGQLDVNIVLDEGPDIMSVMQETYDMLKGYPPGTFPPQMLIEMNPNIPRSEKDRLLQMMQPKPEQVAMLQDQQRLQRETIATRNAKTAAETHRTLAQAEKEAATAQEKRAKVGTEAAHAAHLAHESHLDGAEFVRDTLLEAHRIMQPFLNPPANQNAPQQRAQV